jgi:hypothetical protein
MATIAAYHVGELIALPEPFPDLARDAKSRLLPQLLQAIGPTRKWDTEPLDQQSLDLAHEVVLIEIADVADPTGSVSRKRGEDRRGHSSHRRGSISNWSSRFAMQRPGSSSGRCA